MWSSGVWMDFLQDLIGGSVVIEMEVTMRTIASLLVLGLLSCVSTLALAQGRSAVFTSFDFPGSNTTSPGAITPNGKIVADYVGPDGNQHGFLLSDGTFQ